MIKKSQDFKSPLNTNSKENCGITIETTKLINSEVTNLVSRKLNKDLSTQKLDSINSGKYEKVLPLIQNTIGSQMTGFGVNMDHRSSRLNRTTEVRNPNLGKFARMKSNLTRENSVTSQQSENDYYN